MLIVVLVALVVDSSPQLHFPSKKRGRLGGLFMEVIQKRVPVTCRFRSELRSVGYRWRYR